MENSTAIPPLATVTVPAEPLNSASLPLTQYCPVAVPMSQAGVVPASQVPLPPEGPVVAPVPAGSQTSSVAARAARPIPTAARAAPSAAADWSRRRADRRGVRACPEAGRA